ncbi:flagellar biosynthetic protein FliO [Arthrobacter sp. zg-Y1143]|uniref:FliO/MopB family protein n=1 Tax=Arthrobacter sp. zg-Y1143 TaxID=3049065 RepID=UPI0024C239B1|nr:flagellar biosynthetic protein FliO [Arthrobacter sp. zg-Y1143]MDK1328783.1 flagellar biosynthetic protein FliO [Arthrobacter sp. zg-Y1143]
MDTLFLGLRVLVSLGAVLGLLWWLQRRFSKVAGTDRGEQVPIRVVSRQPITPKASVVVVETGGQRFLLGVTEGAVNVLHTSDLPPEPETADAAPDAEFAASLQAAGDGTADAAAAPTRRAHRAARALPLTEPVPAKSVLGGSILSPETWRQTGNFLRQGRKG